MKIPFSGKQKALNGAINLGESLGGDQATNASRSQQETASHILDATIQIIQQVTEFVSLDIAKNVLKSVTSILILLQKSIKNKADLIGFARRCDALCSTLAQATRDVSMDDISDALSDALRTLNSSIDELCSKVNKTSQHVHVRRLVGATLDANQIGGWTEELGGILTLFSASVNIVSGIRSEQIYGLLKHPEVASLRPDPPPAPPATFFGREDLFAEVKEALLQGEDVALIGPGGIGKSTIAKVLINDENVQERYRRRFFVSYGGMDPVTITSGSFVDRIASALGLSTLGVQSKGQIISNLASSPVLVVLDNAEAFEDAADRDTAEQISSIIAEIANTRGVAILLTSRTSHNSRLVSWTEFDVPPLEKIPARQHFRKMYHGEITDDDIDGLLTTLDFHPLSIHVLACTAKESRWTGEELCERWSTQQSRLLQTGDKENLGFTIRLSLSSPSVKNFGDDARNVLWIIAFFPQGINRKHAARLFPSLPDITSLVDTLCKVSLVFRSGLFWTTLAPIRLFLLDAFPDAGLELLGDIRLIYHDSLQATSKEKDSHADLITSDHLNMEHLIGYSFAHPLDNVRNTTRACRQFLLGLQYHKLRPTSLGPIISSLSETSHDEKQAKAWCLNELGHLYFALSDYASAAATRLAACPLFVVLGNHWMAANCIANAAVSCINRGSFSQAELLLEDFIYSRSWAHIDEEDQADIYYRLDMCKMCTSHGLADQLFLRSVEDVVHGRDSRIRHWTARMYHGYSTPEEVEQNIGPLRSHYMSSSALSDRWRFLSALVDAAFLQRKFETASGLLKQAHDAVGGNFRIALGVLYTQAAVASAQGDYELARSLLQHTLDALSIVATPPCSSFLEMRYVHARNELYAKNYSKACRLLVDIVADCDVHDNLGTKTRCTRALGEVAISLGCLSDSDHYFAQTVELCREAGIQPDFLCVCEPVLRLDDVEFPGWRTYLRARHGQVQGSWTTGLPVEN